MSVLSQTLPQPIGPPHEAQKVRDLYVSAYRYMRPHTTLQVSTAGKKYYADTYIVVYSRHRPICVLITLYVCPNTAIHVCTAGRRATPACCAQESYQLSKCPHTITSVPSYLYMCVLILLYVSSYYHMCPHTNFVVFITTQTFHCGPLY